MSLNTNLDLYKVFFVVAKFKSMTKAAELLYVSQPAVSKSIKNLEEQLGTHLFNRTSKGLEPTAEGELLYERIRPILIALQNVENELTEYKELDMGEVRIGVSSVLTKCILLEALGQFKAKYPNVKFHIKNGLTSSLIQDLKNGIVDFVIFNEGDEVDATECVNVEKLTSLKYVFFTNPQYYSISCYEDVEDKPLILQAETSNTRKFMDKYTNLTPAMEVVSQDLICNLVNVGMGVGFAFEKIVDAINPNFRKVNIPNMPETTISIATVNVLNNASKRFVQMVKDYN